MASNRDIITATLAPFGLYIEDIELEGLLVRHKIDGDGEFTTEQIIPVDTLLLKYLSTILARPDVSEGSLSLKWDRAAVATYVAGLKTDLGITDKPTVVVVDISDQW